MSPLGGEAGNIYTENGLQYCKTHDLHGQENSSTSFYSKNKFHLVSQGVIDSTCQVTPWVFFIWAERLSSLQTRIENIGR